MTATLDDYRKKLLASTNRDPSGCWLFTGRLRSDGYAPFGLWGKSTYAHRVSYLIFKGELPEGLEVDHLCRVRNCVNPEHLRLATPAENNLASSSPAAINARKTHCKHGHPFSPENTSVFTKPGGRPYRRCKTCAHAQWRRWKEKSIGGAA